MVRKATLPTFLISNDFISYSEYFFPMFGLQFFAASTTNFLPIHFLQASTHHSALKYKLFVLFSFVM